MMPPSRRWHLREVCSPKRQMAALGPNAPPSRAGTTGDHMLPAYGLYGHIRNNNIKSTVLLASFALYVALLWFVCCLLWIGLTTNSIRSS